MVKIYIYIYIHIYYYTYIDSIHTQGILVCDFLFSDANFIFLLTLRMLAHHHEIPEVTRSQSTAGPIACCSSRYARNFAEEFHDGAVELVELVTRS